jgi:hypothetical protein
MNTARSRPPASLYVAGPFSMGYVDFFTFLIPLYGLSLGLDAAEIGILVGARSILALFLSIHIGVLMDRFGTRRVTLFFVWTGMALAPLFPLVPGFWALLLLQLVNGAAVSFAWSGAQTLIAQLAEGDAGYIGKFSFFARLGSTTAPILAGMVWDFGGAWPAYLFGAAWGGVLTIALLRTREAEIFGARPADGAGRARFRARDALPRASDYANSIMLVAIPAVAVSMAIISMRNTTDLGLCRLSRADRARRHDHRHPLRDSRDCEWVRLAVCRARGAIGRSSAHNAERHGAVDHADRGDAVAGRDLRIAVAVAGDPRLAGRRHPASHLIGAGESGWSPPARGGCRTASDRAAAYLDRDPAADGRHRRPLGCERKLFCSRRTDAAVVRTARAAHPPRRALRLAVQGGGHSG